MDIFAAKLFGCMKIRQTLRVAYKESYLSELHVPWLDCALCFMLALPLPCVQAVISIPVYRVATVLRDTVCHFELCQVEVLYM